METAQPLPDQQPRPSTEQTMNDSLRLQFKLGHISTLELTEPHIFRAVE